MFGMRLGDIRTTCPKYDGRLEPTWLTTSRLIPRSLLMSTFLRRSHRLVPPIRHRTPISKTSNFRSIFSVIVQVSALYSSTDSTSALYNLVLVSNPMSLIGSPNYYQVSCHTIVRPIKCVYLLIRVFYFRLWNTHYTRISSIINIIRLGFSENCHKSR